MEIEEAFCNVNSNYLWKTSLNENSPVQTGILIIFFLNVFHSNWAQYLPACHQILYSLAGRLQTIP